MALVNDNVDEKTNNELFDDRSDLSQERTYNRDERQSMMIDHPDGHRDRVTMSCKRDSSSMCVAIYSRR